MAKKNAKGRSTRGPPFVALHNIMVDSIAWRSLSCTARAVYVQLARRFNGSNNGYLALSVRDAGDECNVSKNTASRALIELEANGFIECTEASAFSRKDRKAAEWRLTSHHCDRTGTAASRAFRSQSTVPPQVPSDLNNSPISGRHSPTSGTDGR